jgi:predicted site-specific integrase-resolvase
MNGGSEKVGKRETERREKVGKRETERREKVGKRETERREKDSKREYERCFVSVKKASDMSGLDSQTIRKYFDNQLLSGYKTPSGQRKIDISSVDEMCRASRQSEITITKKRDNYLYARVSTRKQMDDLSRQVEFLSRPEFDGYTLVKDIASGINWKRKGLQRILDSCIQGTIGQVVIAHRDRLCRFAFELLQYVIEKGGGSIQTLESDDHKSIQDELADDLLSIICIFNCRQMGRRSYKRKGPDKVQVSAHKDLSDSSTENED